MSEEMTPARHAEWLLEERVRARSGSMAVEEYLRGRGDAEKARAEAYRVALRSIATAVLRPGWELRERARMALVELEGAER